MGNYWTKSLRSRLSRRRLLAASSATAVGAALLAACGSDSNGNEGDGGGLLTEPVDTTAQARRGGVFKDNFEIEPTTWDPTQSGAEYRNQLFSNLIQAKTGFKSAPIGEYTPDLAESWEVSPDNLTLTFKLRSNAHFAPLPPTDGRVVDVEDVKASFDYHEAKGNRRADVFTSVSPGAPVSSITTPNANTVVFKLSAPDVSVWDYISGYLYLVIISKEGAAGQFDMRGMPRGSGPYYLSEYLPSSRVVLQKNPGFHLEGGPWVDTWEFPTIPEYATFLSQFRAGNVWTWDGAEIRAEDLFPTKRAVPDLILVKDQIFADQGQQFFGFRDGPFRDERVRQALSMSYDRELWIDTFFNVSTFAREGVPVETRWSLGGVPAGQQGKWLLDAENQIKGLELGENAKYFQHDIAEAKKLLTAAGFPDGFEAESHSIVSADYGRQHPRMIEVLLQMASDAGMNIRVVPTDYAPEYRPRYRDSKGDFEGTSFVRVSLTPEADPSNRLYGQYHSTGDLFKGFDVDGRTPGRGDPYLDDLVVKIRREFDDDQRLALVHELERYDAKKQYYIRFPGGAESFGMAWPCVSNFGSFKGGPFYWNYWIDDTKAPFRRA